MCRNGSFLDTPETTLHCQRLLSFRRTSLQSEERELRMCPFLKAAGDGGIRAGEESIDLAGSPPALGAVWYRLSLRTARFCALRHFHDLSLRPIHLSQLYQLERSRP